jgi:hypothetical protein
LVAGPRSTVVGRHVRRRAQYRPDGEQRRRRLCARRSVGLPVGVARGCRPWRGGGAGHEAGLWIRPQRRTTTRTFCGARALARWLPVRCLENCARCARSTRSAVHHRLHRPRRRRRSSRIRSGEPSTRRERLLADTSDSWQTPEGAEPGDQLALGGGDRGNADDSA